LGSIRNRRKKLTTLLTDVNSRIRNVELRSTSQEAASTNEETDENFVTPGSYLSSVAPSTWKKVIAGYYYSKQVTGLQNDRVELFLNVDAGLEIDEFLEVSGINAPVEVSYKRKVLGTGEVVGDYRNNKPWFSAIPAGATHALLYSVGAEPGFGESRNLKTKFAISSFSATTTIATIVFNEVHSFNVGNVIDVSELGGNMAGIDGLFFVDTVPSTTSITYKFSKSINAPIASTPATPNKFVYATVHEYVELGDSWINTSTDPDSLFIWDGIRWIAASDPSSVKKDDLQPKPPTNLQVESVAYPNETGFSRASATFSWTAPTQNIDDSELTDLAGYDIQWSGETITGADGGKWASAGGYAFVETSIDIPDLPSGQDVRFRVRAIDTGGLKSEFEGITKLMGSRSDVLLAPSPPIATTRLGTVTVRWDGLQQNGSVPPLFLDYIEVHVASGSNFTPSSSTLVGKIDKTGGDFFVITDLAYNAVRFVRLVFVDQDGKKGAPSTQIQITIKPLVDTDIIGKILSGANIVPGSITASESIIGETITGNLIQALTIRTGNLEANIITADKINAGAVTAVAIAADSITAVKISAGAITASKISAGAVTADTIAANAITSAKINAGAITANKISAGAVNADAIAANSITATNGKIQSLSAGVITAGTLVGRTVQTASSGTRVVMDSSVNRFRVYEGSTLVGNIDGIANAGTTGIQMTAAVGSARLLCSEDGVTLSASPSRRLSFTNTGAVAFVSNVSFQVASLSQGSSKAYVFTNTNGTLFASTSTSGVSDARVKKNVSDSDLGLDFISELRPVKFKWINGETSEEVHRTKYQYGLLAQDVKESLETKELYQDTSIVQTELDINSYKKEYPEIAHQLDETPIMGLDYNQLTPILIKAVQEMSAKIEALDSELKLLKDGDK
jgi:hypothetical protein